MNNLEKYDSQFIECLEVTADDLNEGLVYQSVANWDSVGHMQLIAALEDIFDITFDTDEIIDFNSYNKGKELLGNHGVEF